MLVARDLPSISGVEVTRLVRQREDGLLNSVMPGSDHFMPPRLPVLAFTDQAETEHLRQYMEAGMDGCICKPVEVDALLQTVAAAVP